MNQNNRPLEAVRIAVALLLLLPVLSIGPGIQIGNHLGRHQGQTNQFASEGDGRMQTLDATVVRSGDFAKIIFQPVNVGRPMSAFGADGVKLGTIDWQGLFEVEVSEDKLEKATTPEGIDISALLHDIGAVSTVDGKSLIRAEIPYSVVDQTGTELSAGQSVYFELNTILRQHEAEPVGAYAKGTTPHIEAAVNTFNDRLNARGVKGSKSSFKNRGTQHSSRAVHQGIANVPLDSADDVVSPDSTAFLSPPTCSCVGRNCVQTYRFGHRNSHRTTNGQRSSSFHTGIDIAGGLGTPVVAAASGCVQKVLTNRNGGWGLTVYLKHANGLVSQYSHMGGFANGVRPGQCFERGERIGQIGKTGNCTGPHLHFGVYKSGKAVDPRNHLLTDSGTPGSIANGHFSRTCDGLAAFNRAFQGADTAEAAGAHVVADDLDTGRAATAQRTRR